MPNPALAGPAAHRASAPGPSPAPAADGPLGAQEWWVATDPAAPTTADAWARPYLLQTQLSGNAGVAGQAAAPPGFLMTHAPLMVRLWRP